MQRRVDIGEALQRREQHQHRDHERGEFACGRAPGERILERDIDDDRDRDRREDLRDGCRCGGGDGLAHVESAQTLVGALEAPHLVLLAAEYLDHLVTLDRLFENLHQLAHRALRFARHLPQAARQLAHHERKHWGGGKRNQGELPVQKE